MAIIKCAECGKEISESADRCPNCGYLTPFGRERDEGKGLLIFYALDFLAMIVGAVFLLRGNLQIGAFLLVFGVIWMWLLNWQGKKFTGD